MSVSLDQVLSAINQGLSVVQQVASLPGVSALPYASTLSSAINAIQAAEQAEQDIAPYVEAIAATFSGTVPTQEQLDALDAQIVALDAQVDAPLPPPESGEPA